jgi:alpha-D-ribose 1-methylphosphonate 5-triphosphate diphosphatase
LCSDYYPPAIIHAIFKLHLENGLSLPEAVNLGTLHPAKAAGISHYTGSIEKGKDADVLIVKLVNAIPMVTQTIVKGRVAAQVPGDITYNKPLN